MRWKKILQNILTIGFVGVFFLVLSLGILRYKKQSISDKVQPVAVTNSAKNTVSNSQNNSTTSQSNSTTNTTTNTVTKPVTTPTQPTTATYTGTEYETPFGPVSVSITVSNKKITDVSTPTYPDSPPSVYAHDTLVQQALSTSSANIQGVSGATYTSLAFSRSLESAISKAGSSL